MSADAGPGVYALLTDGTTIEIRPARRKTGLRTRNYTETTLEVSHGRP